MSSKSYKPLTESSEPFRLVLTSVSRESPDSVQLHFLANSGAIDPTSRPSYVRGTLWRSQIGS